MKHNRKKPDVLVVGGGPAGMFAAASAARAGASVVLLEKNKKLGKKMSIAGGGRCNLTNTAPVHEFIKNVPGNGKFLTGILSRFGWSDCVHFLKSLGIKTKEEEMGKIFPEKDRAEDVVAALESHLLEMGIKILLGHRAKALLKEGGQCLGAELEDGTPVYSKTLIIATGGSSYPGTGSTGDGYFMAGQAGHKVITPRPGLVPVTIAERKLAEKLQGLSVRDSVLCIEDDTGKKIEAVRGDFIITHFGVSGPAALGLSRTVSALKGSGSLRLLLDFMPEVKEDFLAERMLAAARDQPRKSVAGLLKLMMPDRLAITISEIMGVDAQKKSAEAGKNIWRKAAGLVKRFPLSIKGTRPLAEAMVTVGGVCTGEVNPRTMESKLLKGLYFAGEVIDVDAYTGGFNMQIAFSTGWLAGLSAAKKAHTECLSGQNSEARIQNPDNRGRENGHQ